MRTIQDNILLLKNTEEIWKVIINKDCLSSNDKLVFGFSNIVREAFKVTNLEKKSKLFTLA